MAAPPSPVFTVGHSNRSLEELVDLLRENEVRTLVDVRRIPRSRSNPHFDRQSLGAALPRRGIDYLHDSRLGGRRGRAADAAAIAPEANAGWRVASFRNYADWALGPEFAAAKEDLLALWRRGRKPAILCAEAVWWRCHRRIIADWVIAAGASVYHIMGPGRLTVATMTPGAWVDETGRVTYPPSD